MAVCQWRVILWDQQPLRRARIRQLIHALGARVIEILDLQRDLPSCACCVAALGISCEPDGAGMRAELALATRAELVQRIGHVALFYRANPEKQRIMLPD